MRTREQLRASAIADQSTAKVIAARKRLVDAIVSRSGERIAGAIIDYGLASWEAGWDQCDAEHEVVIEEAIRRFRLER